MERGSATGLQVERIAPQDFDAALHDLAVILHDCVHGGASVNFLVPFAEDEARGFFERIAPGVRSGAILVFGARLDGRLIGTVQLVPAHQPNQPHRGDIAKLLVHRNARRHGAGRALMLTAEDEARVRGLTLLTLDTVADSAADRLYRELGWTAFGVVPGYALSTAGVPERCAFFYKELR